MPRQRIRARSRKPLIIVAAAPVLVFLLLAIAPVRSQNPSGATGVLRIRVRVKIGEATKGLSRKRFYLIKGTLEQNKAVIEAAEKQTIVGRDCYYSKIGASQALIDWLKDGDCESVYCREVEAEFVSGPKAVPEFASAYSAGEKEFGALNGRKWLTNNLSAQIRDGFYQERRKALQALMAQAGTLSGSPVLSVMTDRNGTAYFTDLEPGNYVLTNLLPVEISDSVTSWNCDVQIKAGDIATEKPYLVSNRKDRTVKCVGIEKPMPPCVK